MYTPPYLPQVPFSAAYMNLCDWRDAPEASENRLVGIRLMFIHASEASRFLPVANFTTLKQHNINLNYLFLFINYFMI